VNAEQQEEPNGATKLPIDRVVLFSAGVGYFEHNGRVEGDARVDLRFRTDDINDLLKSMVLQDEGGGRISAVSYGSKDPLTRTLATFSIDLTQNPTLADLLNQIRGEQIEIDAPTKITGTILGVEKREVPAGKDKDRATVETAFLNLLTDDGLRSVSLDGVGRITLIPPLSEGAGGSADVGVELAEAVDGLARRLKSLGVASLLEARGRLRAPAAAQGRRCLPGPASAGLSH
jgi:hypothetical protein